jgi:hypothetical protein
VKHLEENVSAALLEVDDSLMEELERLSSTISPPAEAA